MRRTYAYNSIYFGLLFGAAIGAVTKSVVLGIVSGIIITVIFFVLIRAMENAISKKTDKLVSSITRKLDEKHLGKVQTQQAVNNVQPQQVVDSVQSQQPVNDVQTQQSASTEVIDCKWVCPKCGTKLDEECLFCPKCGNAVANNSNQQLVGQDKMATNEALNASYASNVSPTTSNGHMNDSSFFSNHKVIGIISILLSSITVIHYIDRYYIRPFIRMGLPFSHYLNELNSFRSFLFSSLFPLLSFLIIWFIIIISLLTKKNSIRLLAYVLIPLPCWTNIWQTLMQDPSRYGFKGSIIHYFSGLCPVILIIVICIILMIWALKRNSKNIILLNILIAIMLLAVFSVRLLYNNTNYFGFMPKGYALYAVYEWYTLPFLLAGLLINNVITLDYRKHLKP